MTQISKINGIPIFDTSITGVTYSNNLLTISNNNGGNYTTTINSFTGVTTSNTFSGSTFIKSGATSNDVLLGDGTTATKLALKPTLSKTMTILSATTSDNFTLFRAEVPLTIQEVNAVVVGSGSPNCNVQLIKHATRSSSGTTVVSSVVVTGTTTGQQLTVITAGNANKVAANEWIWVRTPTVTTMPDSTTIDVRYTED